MHPAPQPEATHSAAAQLRPDADADLAGLDLRNLGLVRWAYRDARDHN